MSDDFEADDFEADTGDDFEADDFEPDAPAAKPEQGGFEGFAQKALPVMRSAMEVPERYIAAPTRAAIDATLHKPFGFDAIPAFVKQFGEDPEKAPTSGRILNRLGVNIPSVDFPTPFRNVDGTAMKGNTKAIGEGIAGAVMDPTMYIFPEVGPTVRTAGRMAEAGANTAAKKMARIAADVPEAATERFIQNPRAVNQASSHITPHVGRWNDMMGQLEKQIFEGSAESRKALEGKQFNLSDIANVFQEVKDEIVREAEGVIDPGLQQRINAIDSMLNAYNPKPKSAPSGYLNLDGTPVMKQMQGPTSVSGNRVKNLVQQLQRKSNFKQGAGDFLEVSDIDKNKIMRMLNSKLKENPDYADIMKGVADDMDLLDRATALGKTDGALEGVFKNFGKSRELPVNIVQEVDKRLGTKFYDELLNTVAKRSFENTNPNGFRRTGMGAVAGLLPASVAMSNNNPVMAALLQFGMAAGGFAADKYGGTMMKGAVRGMTFPTRAAKGIAEMVGQRLPRDSRYWQILTEAANKSPKSLVVTHHLLMSSDPEYRKNFEDQP